MARPMSMVAAVLFLGVTAGVTGAEAPGSGAAGSILSDPAPAIYVDEVTGAAAAFLSLLDEAQRDQALMPYASPDRVSGRDMSRTPAFCAVLAWCEGWGLSQCSLDYTQRRGLARLLATALADNGYQTIRAILNSHRDIGELEEIADADFVARVAQQCPTLEADSIFDIPAACLPDGEPGPPYVALGGAVPLGSTGGYKVEWRWPNGPPKLQARYQQFCDHNIAFFGEPGSERWAFRFEGHHLTVNLTFERDSDGGYRVHATPLFLGSFPMVVAPSPEPENTDRQLTWTASQELLLQPLNHARQFVAALPPPVRQAARLADSPLEQAPPLASDAVPNWLLASVFPDPRQPLPDQPAAFSTADLDELAAWHLRLLLRHHFDALHPILADRYTSELDRLLAEGATGSILWAGDPPERPDGVLFLHVVVGPFLLELNADNQWSVHHRGTPRVNHLHSMLRDLSFRWDYDATERPDADHHQEASPATSTDAE